MFAALMIVLKEIMAFIPNVHPVAILIILAAHWFGLYSLLPIYVFVMIEGFLYGFHIWWVCYLYVWAILAIIITVIRKYGSTVIYTIVAAIFGILFGTLCSIPYFITGGFGCGVSWIISGLSYDMIHMISNTVSVVLLFYPLNTALERSKVAKL